MAIPIARPLGAIAGASLPGLAGGVAVPTFGIGH